MSAAVIVSIVAGSTLVIVGSVFTGFMLCTKHVL